MVLKQKEYTDSKPSVLKNLADNILNGEKRKKSEKPYGEYKNPRSEEEYLTSGIDGEDADEWLGKALQNNSEKNVDNPKKTMGKKGEIKENLSKEQQADRLIIKYTKIIKEAGKKFDVDECIIAGVIYREQVFYDALDMAFDSWGRFGLNTSIGIGQVKLGTAELVENRGYIPKISQEEITRFGSERSARVERLENDEYNIYYVAAYLKNMQDIRKGKYPSISRRPDILATLYNIGKEDAHPNPKPNDFGKYVQSKYEHIKELMRK